VPRAVSAGRSGSEEKLFHATRSARGQSAGVIEVDNWRSRLEELAHRGIQERITLGRWRGD